MNMDLLKGKWTQLKGTVKERWGELTDDDLERVDGNADQLIGLIQEKYGTSRAQAEQELEKWLSGS